MPQEKVELLRAAYDYVASTCEVPPEAVHPDFVWDTSTFRWPERQAYPGIEGAREVIADWLEDVGRLGVRGSGTTQGD